jgi:hypothetical protein
MTRRPLVAASLSLLVPGLGHVYGGQSWRGGAIIAAAIVIGNLNIIILPLIAIANPQLPPAPSPHAVWAYWIPRIVHDVVSFWSIVFWLWAIGDAYRNARPKANAA